MANNLTRRADDGKSPTASDSGRDPGQPLGKTDRIDPDDLPQVDTEEDSVFDPVPADDLADPEDDPVSDDEWRDRGGIDDISAPPQPLDFDDGTEGRPNGPRPERDGGTWQDEGADSGRLKPPSEMHSDDRTRKTR